MAKEIRVYITNRQATLTSKFDAEALKPFLSYSDPKYKWKVQYKPWLRKCVYCDKWELAHKSQDHEYRPVWDGREHFLRGNELPAGLFWATRKEIEEALNIKFIVKGDLERAEYKEEGIVGSDRDYQNECVSQMLKTLRFGGGLVLGATGTGKTRIAAQFFSRLRYSALFVVDQLILLKQAQEELETALNEPIGHVGDEEFSPERITVATRQSLYLHRRENAFLKWTNNLQVILIDEIHSQLNHSTFSVIENIQPLAVYGLTATLGLKKKNIRLRAHSVCGPVIFNYDLVRGQQEGVLSDGIAIRIVFKNEIPK